MCKVNFLLAAVVLAVLADGMARAEDWKVGEK